ncbi:MAG: class I SAM-dependent methyltransferase [Deltaproteobacteria bacterium]|nr:class I SAM-dependent methyltransferase [Deltaproteobacteria bacterium]
MTAECPVCAGHNADESFTKDGFRHFHCRDCNSLYLFPTPSKSALFEYYVAREEATRSSQCWEREENAYRHYEPIWDQALRQIEKDSGRGPLLDVGCGGGQFLAFARQRGWEQLEGIEYAPGAATRARERTGAEVHTVDFLASGLEPAQYAGITMWNVIEHAADPRAFVAEVYRLLRPAGTYVADCPNRYGITMRAIGKEAYVVMPPEHLTYFGHRSLRRLLENAGLEVRKLASNTIYINDWVRFLTKPAKEQEAREAHLSWYSRMTGTSVGMLLIGLANVALNAAHLGDQMLVFAQRPEDQS